MSRPALVTPEQWRALVDRSGPGSPLRTIDRPRKKREHPEHDGQAEYFATGVERLQKNHPESAHLFDLTYANPQQGQSGGKNGKVWGAYFAAEGKKPGVPDLTHPVARFGYHGLYVENKVGRAPLTDEQVEWAIRLQRQGYAVAVCRAFTPSQLAASIEYVIGRYTMFSPQWHAHIPPHEKWL